MLQSVKEIYADKSKINEFGNMQKLAEIIHDNVDDVSNIEQCTDNILLVSHNNPYNIEEQIQHYKTCITRWIESLMLVVNEPRHLYNILPLNSREYLLKI